MPPKYKTLIYIICLAVWVAVINAGRGSGDIHNLKPFELVFMYWGGYRLSNSNLTAFFYTLPMAVMFAVGTGELMALLVPYASWRFWEMAIGFGWTIIFFLPLWAQRKI